MTSTSSSIDYESAWLVAEAGTRSHIVDALAALIQQYVIRDRLVIELGSGIGTNLQVFRGTNEILGVEGMPDAVAESIRRGVPSQVGDLEQPLAVAGANADWVLCIDVLEHLKDPLLCLESARRLLNRDGRLVVNVPNHFDWRGRLRVARGSGIDSQHYFPNSPVWRYPHLRFFGRRSIEALLQEAGFAVEVDLAPRFLSFPKAHVWRWLGLQRQMLWAQSRWPDLLSSGFFLVCKRV
jgi:SAM-dependent methyltransferase